MSTKFHKALSMPPLKRGERPPSFSRRGYDFEETGILYLRVGADGEVERLRAPFGTTAARGRTPKFKVAVRADAVGRVKGEVVELSRRFVVLAHEIKQFHSDLTRVVRVADVVPETVSALVELQEQLAAEVTLVETLSAVVPNAASALAELKHQLAAEGFLAEGLPVETDPAYQGQQLLVQWTQDGTLIPAQKLGDSWGLTRQALASRVKTGQLFNVKVNAKLWYASVLADLRADHVAQICEAFGTADGVDHLLFWQRQHGSLKGLTVAQALKEPSLGLDRVLRLARGIAQERA